MKLWKKIAIGTIAALSFITASSSLYVVDQTKQAIVTRFGNPKRVILNPIQEDELSKKAENSCKEEGIAFSKGAGLYCKVPFIDSVRKFDRRMLRWDGYPEEIPTKDKKYLWVDSSVRFFIYDPLKFFRTVGAEEQAHARLDDIVDAATRNSITSRNLIEIVRTSNRKMQVAEKELEETIEVGETSEGREKIAQEICDKAREICEQYGIAIHPKGYLIKGVVYVAAVKEEVEKRMISERVRVAAKYRSEGEGEYQKIMGEKEKDQKTIMSEAYKRAQEIKGAAEAEALKIYADIYNKDPNFYKFLKTLEVYETGLNPGTRIMLGTDNELLGLLKGTSKSTTTATQK